ncbi:MAG TPA: AAA family ATPase, partial [Candidatus Altiarchaeales archaeon]|nr:AAA family ATPase [Candidatus Altiarchaeales archaeon]
MKIQRVKTRSFAISKSLERKYEKIVLKEGIYDELRRIVLGTEKANINKIYKPVAKLRISVPRYKEKGIISVEKTCEILENFFFVDLTDLGLYFVSKSGSRKVELKKFDLLKKLINLPDSAISLFGELSRTDFLFYDELNRADVQELLAEGLVKIFKPRLKVFISMLWETLADEALFIRDRVKSAYRIPKVTDPRYNLSEYIKETNMLVEHYRKGRIKYSIDKIAHVLKLFYNGKVTLDGLYFLPCIQGFEKKKGKKVLTDEYYPLATIHIDESEIIKGKPMRPIALSTSITSKFSVPVEESTITFKDVANLEEAKDAIREAIIYPIKRPELAKAFKRRVGGSILLYGPPGCGKTYLAKAAIGESGVVFFNVNISEIVQEGIAQGAKHIHEVFEEASKYSPAIIFFDEIDAIGYRRSEAKSQEERMEIDQLLMELDSIESLSKDILVIAATNAPWNIDPALRRTMRFTKHIFIPPPDFETRKEVFRIHTRGMPLAKDIDFNKLAELTEGYSCSDIKAICDRAAEIP